MLKNPKAKGLTCKCGCGRLVNTKRGFVYVHGHNSKGANHPNWKGGKRKDNYGYILIWNPSHPNSMSGGYIREQRLVMERKIGRLLFKDEEVHHINGIKTDNREENLQILSKKQHGHISGLLGGRKLNPNALTRIGKCKICGRKYYAGGLCSIHYTRMIEHGTIDRINRITNIESRDKTEYARKYARLYLKEYRDRRKENGLWLEK